MKKAIIYFNTGFEIEVFWLNHEFSGNYLIVHTEKETFVYDLGTIDSIKYVKKD